MRTTPLSKSRFLLTIVPAATLLSACSAKDTYEFGHSIGRSKAECETLTSHDERERCERQFAMDYETYKAQREEL